MLRRAHSACLLFLVVAGCFGDAAFGKSSIQATEGTCAFDGECAAPDEPCVQSVCEDGRCQEAYVPAGAPIAKQTPGDCVVTVCDGQGAELEESDPTDAADDGDPCTLEGCSPGGPVSTPVPAGTTCGDHACCNPRGLCVGYCIQDADCGPPVNTPCQKVTCNECGECMVAVSPQGTLPPDDVLGDCNILVCDGAGGFFRYPDETDVPPDDGDLCTLEYCANGTPIYDAVECQYPQTCRMGVCI